MKRRGRSFSKNFTQLFIILLENMYRVINFETFLS